MIVTSRSGISSPDELLYILDSTACRPYGSNLKPVTLSVSDTQKIQQF